MPAGYVDSWRKPGGYICFRSNLVLPGNATALKSDGALIDGLGRATTPVWMEKYVYMLLKTRLRTPSVSLG